MSQVFVGNGSGGGGGSGIQTITGNDGTPESPSAGNFNIVTANSTPQFKGTSATETLDFGLSNLILGSAPPSILGASNNAGYGVNSLLSLTSGDQNCAFGALSMEVATSASASCAIGFESLASCTTGQNNQAFGNRSLTAITTGSNNLALGNDAGQQYTTEGSNICINHIGVVADAHVIRIGTQGGAAGQQNKCFVAGITGATPTSGNTPQVVLCDNAGQLTPISSSTAGFVLTSNGSATPSFQAATGSGVTISGDSGSITGSSLTIFANNATVNSGSSVLFSNSVTTSTLNVSDVNLNTMIGSNAGNLTMSGAGNAAFSVNAGKSLTSGAENCFFGAASGENLTSGSNNICLGFSSGSSLVTGTESSNIIIGHLGVTGDNHTIRIGTTGAGTGTQNLCYVAGINGATPVNANVPKVTLCDSQGNLTNISSSTAGFVLTSNGTNAPSFQAPSAPAVTAFRAHLNANTAANLTGDTTQVIVPFDTVDYDTASGYNTGTSTYTIPTTGYWQINYTVFAYRTAGVNTVIILDPLLNGATQFRNYEMNFETIQSSGECTLTGAMQNHFTSGDTLQIQCEVGGVSKNIGFAGTFCVFSAYLIG